MPLHPLLPTALGYFADLLGYPQPGTAEKARLCAETIVQMALPAPEAEALRPAPDAFLSAFAVEIAAMSFDKQEEVYASTFDLGGAFPYIGYQLMGETHKRSVFMLELKQRYAPYGVEMGIELPDHLSNVLRYLSVLQDETEFREMVQFAVLPSLDKVLNAGRMRNAEGPALPLYLAVLHALYYVLVKTVGDPMIKAEDWETEYALTHAQAMQEMPLGFDEPY
jgi:nitrate reductase delta subunit